MNGSEEGTVLDQITITRYLDHEGEERTEVDIECANTIIALGLAAYAQQMIFATRDDEGDDL